MCVQQLLIGSFSSSYNIILFSNGVQHFALTLSSFQILVSLGRLFERKGGIDGHLQLAVRQPPKDFPGPPQQLLPIHRVIQQFGTRHVGRLANQAQDGKGGDGPRGVAKGHENAPSGQRVDGNVHGRFANAVNDALDTLPTGDLHDARRHVDRFVVLVRGARRLVQQNELVAARLFGNGALADGRRANHLVAADFGHLRGPLAGAAGHAVNETPLTGLDQIGVRRGGQVVRRHALHDARRGHVEADRVGDGQEFGGGYGRVLGVRAKDRVGDALSDGNAGRFGFLGHRRHFAAAFLAADKGQIALVQAFAVVRVNEINAGKLVVDNDTAGFEFGDGKVVFDL